jgi:hypothetical protein
VKRSKNDTQSANDGTDASKNEAGPSEPASNASDQQPDTLDTGLNLAPSALSPDKGANAAPMAQATPVSAPQLPNNQSRKLHICPAVRVHILNHRKS